jgi:hypothetical protein
MTTLRRASRLLRGESATALLAALLLVVAVPAFASSHGGGGGHSSGGHSSGGHFSAGSHFSGGNHGGGHFTGGSAHAGRPAFGFGSRGHFFGGGFHGGFHGRFFGGFGYGFYNPFLFGVALSPFWGPSYWAGYYGYYYPWDYYGYPSYYAPYSSAPAYPPPPSSDDSYDDQSGPPPAPSQQQQYGGGGRHGRMGALDLDVSPADTEVYLNGKKLGIVDDYDGWPDYLWLQPGTYDIVFYHDGFKTLARQVTVYPGQKITYNDHLERGQAIRPEDLQSKSHVRRDQRMSYEDQRNHQVDQQGGAPAGAATSDDWQNRVRADRAQQGTAVQGQSVDRMPAGGSTHLHLSVDPADASVYLDGRFVGLASEVNENGAGLVVAPGSHRLSVLRPGRKAEERDFDVTAGRDLDIDVKLERNQR